MLVDMVSLEEFAEGDLGEMRKVLEMAMNNKIVHEIRNGELFVASLSGELVSNTQTLSGRSASDKRQLLWSGLANLLDTGQGPSNTDCHTLPVDLDDGISMESYVDGFGEVYTRNAYDGRLRTAMGSEWD